MSEPNSTERTIQSYGQIQRRPAGKTSGLRSNRHISENHATSVSFKSVRRIHRRSISTHKCACQRLQDSQRKNVQVALLEKFGHPVAGLLCERQLEEFVFRNKDCVSARECRDVHRNSQLLLSVYVDDETHGWKERKKNGQRCGTQKEKRTATRRNQLLQRSKYTQGLH